MGQGALGGERGQPWTCVGLVVSALALCLQKFEGDDRGGLSSSCWDPALRTLNVLHSKIKMGREHSFCPRYCAHYRLT